MGTWKGEELPKKGYRRTLITCLDFSTISSSSIITLYMFIWYIHQNRLVYGAWKFLFLWIAEVIEKREEIEFSKIYFCQQFRLKPVKLGRVINTFGSSSFLIFTNIFNSVLQGIYSQLMTFHSLVQLSLINALFPLKYSKWQDPWNVIQPTTAT